MDETNAIRELLSSYESKQEWLLHARATLNVRDVESHIEPADASDDDDDEAPSDSDSSTCADEPADLAYPPPTSAFPQSHYRTSSLTPTEVQEKPLLANRRSAAKLHLTHLGHNSHKGARSPAIILSLYASLIRSRIESCHRIARLIQRQTEASQRRGQFSS